MICSWFGAALPSAQAATWANDRTTPHIRDLVSIDRTGESRWPFGAEDVAGDGLERFEVAERGVDVRSAYLAVDSGRLWLRAYVSSDQAPVQGLRVYSFIDTDSARSTGGSAAAPEIDAAFTEDGSPGGYDVVVGMPGEMGDAARVWEWNAEQGEYVEAQISPFQGTGESGTDRDPLRLLTDTHGYVQVVLNAERLGVAPSCDSNLLIRASVAGSASDRDVGRIGRCIAGDLDGNRVPDLLEETESSCEQDNECPAGGLCVSGRCVLPSYCRVDADCADDETCTDDGVCRARGGATCSADEACSGGLVCMNATMCGACTGDGSCDDGDRCAASGRCVDERSRSGSGSSGAVVLGPGEEVQGGAGTCGISFGGRRVSSGALVVLVGLAVIAIRRRRRGWGLLVVLLGLLASDSAQAQVDAERFKPAVTHDGWVNAEGSAVRDPDDRWQFGATLSYARNPLIVANGEDGLVTPIVSGRLGFDLLASATLTERFALGLGVPVFTQSGDAAGGGGLGDLRIVPKLELLNDVGSGIGMALAAEVRAPTHSGDFSGGSDAFSVFPKVILDHRYPGGVRIGANVGVILRKDRDYLNVTSGDEFAYAIGAAYRLGGIAGKTEIGVDLEGGVNLSDPGDEEVALEALGFLRQDVGHDWQVQGGAGAGVLDGYGVPTWRFFLGVTWRPTSHDHDYDGVTDVKDQCAEFAEDRDGIDDTDGCPEEDPDGDHDGVSDYDDECPTTAETINGIEDEDGCPDSGDRRVRFDDGEFVVLDTIRFETGSADIHPEAYSLLNQVALTLRAHPEIEHMRIEGHTDDTGPRDVNMILSERRARAVKRYLVERGVGPGRLSTRSYGPDKPREAGTGSQARAVNRRVEFIVE